MTEQIVSVAALWLAGNYDPLAWIAALSWVITALLFIGTSPLWAAEA